MQGLWEGEMRRKMREGEGEGEEGKGGQTGTPVEGTSGGVWRDVSSPGPELEQRSSTYPTR